MPKSGAFRLIFDKGVHLALREVISISIRVLTNLAREIPLDLASCLRMPAYFSGKQGPGAHDIRLNNLFLR